MADATATATATTQEPLLEIRDVSVFFPIEKGVLKRVVGHVRAVDSVSLTIHRGKTLGLVGESGSGKTTLGLALLRLEKSEGAIDYGPHRLSDFGERRVRPLRREMQIVFQDPYASLSPRMSVGQIVGEGLRVHDLTPDGAAHEELIDAALSEVGIDPATKHRYPHEFSGGQRQRIGIARSLAVDPDILLMDEPFGALDAITRNALQDELLRIWKETGKSILFVTHDIEEAVYLGDRVLLLGDTPAHIINEYRVDIDRAERRESAAFLRQVEKVRGGLQAAIDAAKNND